MANKSPAMTSELTVARLEELQRLENADCLYLEERSQTTRCDFSHLLPELLAAARAHLQSRAEREEDMGQAELAVRSEAADQALARLRAKFPSPPSSSKEGLAERHLRKGRM